jgi:hypothetical protein
VGIRAVRLVRPFGGGEILKNSLVLPLVIGACVAVTLLLIRFGRQPLGTLAVGVLPVLFTIEAVSLAGPLLPNESRDTLYPQTAATGFLQRHVGHDRVAVEGQTYYGNAGMLAELRIPTGHSFYSQTWKEMIGTIDPQAFALSPTLPSLRADPEVYGAAALDRLGVSWFATTPETAPFGEREDLQVGSASCARDTADPTLAAHEDAVETTVPSRNGLRGIVLRVCDDAVVPTGSKVVVRATLAGTTVTSTQHVRGTVSAGELVLAVPGDELVGTGNVELSVSLEGASGARLSLASGPGGAPAVDAIRPADDGLQLAFADELRIYRRTTALPRIRWAASAEVIEDDGDRLARVASHDTPDGTVVLSEGRSGGSGLPADIEILADTPDEIRVRVDARGDGYLVVADALQEDWKASLGGESAALVDADHAGVAVAVPAGRHEVVLRAAPRGLATGRALSGLTALALTAVGVASLSRQRRRLVDAPAEPESTAGPQRPSSLAPSARNNP